MIVPSRADPRTPSMTHSIPLGRAFGIPIVLSRYLVMLVALGMFLSMLGGINPLIVLVLAALVMGLVLLHELGHSLTARHFGVHVSHITLWPLGGVAWMNELPRDSRIEALVAVAGPAVNLVLALVSLPIAFFAGPLAPFAWFFLKINLALGLFNLLPAFPMDGGRVLRAFLARRGDWLGATERAVSIGRSIALVIGVGGLLTGHLMLAMVAVFLWIMGQRELLAMRLREMGASWPFNPGAADAGGQEPPRDWNEPAAPRRPADGQPNSDGGFSAADIERLERHHGRLPRNWQDE